MNRRSFLIQLGAGTALALGAASRPASAEESVEKALEDIAKARSSLKTMVAPFTQERTIGLLSSTVVSTGEMTLVAPDSLRWELKPPDAITYWITPAGLSFTDAAGGSKSLAKSQAGRFGAVLSDLLILLGGDLSKLRERYDLSVPRRDASSLTLIARPRAADVKKVVKSLEMTAGPDLWRVTHVVIEEKSGDRSVIKFDKVAKNAAVDPKKMRP